MMKKFLMAIAIALMSISAQAALVGVPFTPEVDQRFDNLEGNSTANAKAGLHVKQMAVGIWDYSKQGGSSAATIPLGFTLPKNALVTKSYFYVPTQVTGTVDTGGNRAQASFGCVTATDILAATDFPARTPNHEYSVNGLQMDTAGSGDSIAFLKVNAGCTPYMTLTYGNFTAGKIILFLEYVVR